MKKRVLSWAVIFAFILAGSAMVQAKPIKINFGHPLPPNHPNHLAAEKFAKLAMKNSNGRIKVDIYPANQLGNAKQLCEGVMLGTIKMALTSPARVGLFQPEFAILECPYPVRPWLSLCFSVSRPAQRCSAVCPVRHPLLKSTYPTNVDSPFFIFVRYYILRFHRPHSFLLYNKKLLTAL